MAEFHQPVLLQEINDYLKVADGEKYIDATIGGGGHGIGILKIGGILLGIDCDPEAITAAKRRFSTACPNASWQLAQENFVHLKKIADKYGFNQVAGILFDLGVSSHQLEVADRGFSFKSEKTLDMRMDPTLTVTAADLVNGLNFGELNELFFKFGQEPNSGRIAKAIVEARRITPVKTGKQLADIIEKVVPVRSRFGRIHPATRCFQALRIAVNDELNNLKKVLPQAVDLLKPEGRLAVISFHSGEDRIVKIFFKEKQKENLIKILTKKPIRPGLDEIKINPKSRSAKLRVAQKL